jgi:predicted ATPase
MDGQTLDFVRNGEESGSFSLMVKRGKARVNLSDVGEGTNQVLPVITQSFINDADITIIEQAGLHLHPSAHAHVAYRIAEAAKQSGKTYVIESHSENFVLGLRNMIAHENLNPADVAIYYIDHDGESATAQLYEVERNGSMSDWPTGVFTEDFELLKEISKAAR